MDRKEHTPMSWLEQDPFHHLQTRDLLHTVSQGVVGGPETMKSSIQLHRMSDDEISLLESCISLTDRGKNEDHQALPETYYTFYWLLVSTICKNHILAGMFGSSPPTPDSQEAYEQQLLDEQETVDDVVMQEASARINENDYAGFLDYLYAEGTALISSFADSWTPREVAFEDFRRAHEDAATVLERILSHTAKREE